MLFKTQRPSYSKLLILLSSLLINVFLLTSIIEAKDYYYTRIRNDPNHLRISEEFKNRYTEDIKYVSRINGTRYEYYMSSSGEPDSESSKNSIRSYDELIFETIDKMSQHRLSPFYIHHYDSDTDKKLSSDSNIVSRDACARDLLYLVDKIPKYQLNNRQYQGYKVNDPQTDYFNLKDDADQMTPELLAFFDSYAKQEAGLLMGNTYWVGGYDQCINRHIFDPTSGQSSSSSPLYMRHDQKHDSSVNLDQQVISFKGRYCVAALKSPAWDPMIKKRQERGSRYFKTERLINDYSRLFRLQLGICMPDSCDSSSLERHSEEIKLLATSLLEPRFSDYHLEDLYCLPDETSQLRSWSGSALYFLIFITIWLILLALATAADVFELVTIPSKEEATAGSELKKDKKVRLSRGQKFVLWFSLRANYNKLMKVNEEHPTKPEKLKLETSEKVDEKDTSEKDVKKELPEIQINLRFLNGFKVLIMFWIITGHIMLLMIQTAKNILNSDALLNGLMHFLIGATFGVDLFFTITGFLTAYLIFKSGHAFKMRLPGWIGLSFHRYWRLAPMYLMAFWFSRSVVQLLGSGPLWDYGTSNITFRGLCNSESWWYPFTLTSNLHGLFDECMITSWYISCDMQFWLVSPIFIHLLAKSPLYGWAASIGTIVVSSKFRYDVIVSEQTARYDELIQPRADIFMRVSYDLPALYTHPHHRISAYLVGLLAGHYVYMVQSRKWSSSLVSVRSLEQNGSIESSSNKSRSTIAYFGLTLCVIMSFVSYILSHYFPSSMLVYAKLLASLAYSVDHFLMSFGASLCIVAMCFGQWSKTVKFLSHPNWTRVSKINYALLLLQCEAIYYQIFRYDQVPMAGTKELVNILFNLLVTLYPVAFFVTLAFEFPLANLEKALLPL